ncbi:MULTISPECIES: 3-oxoacyl-[acyl-carrier-protein] reductase [unclassified Lentimonas]|uniref:3-oxoacyl-[acyl-carrier-protein] reductase n=1 Tax=unclassified Lentimonas TaxID=2630993 RepID=UPI00132BF212|nr:MULTISPECIES: 3-oxoacyl-[acyl-carrier-protein] reductase [unclassified Lentimonas]CAA6678904.1 3-oxoacyl-[acyl-carrier protein] reductase (EC [Lentimonas sp. CC4]CAA6684510.1 3-oxoacyl-[acyl-carrier protein] reductase (EC [Lentimonas sp. CC6]CAA6693828.1 3-oxoacyl-[acyl-carrier protein] reductase (EC [Lentimonas sp. CC19]CAA6695137.1 3-oxoacyl-[acyl-carrier protein] reductase (EC [Lentimonas sp. CC10]CAA7069706.1 3-oxoacyl-[acyl-carrier protein] reductase (EC [Lentimonas sp. CC11]
MTETTDKRIALVTGAGRGIGKSIAELLASKGHHVICVSRSASSCGAVADAINASGGSAQSLAVDVADNAAVLAASEQLLKEHGNIDILVNNAGITKDGLLFRMSDDAWSDVIDTNLTSCFSWIKNLARPMTRKRWGRIINISSVIGLTGNAGQANYAAAKAGMLGLTKSLAKEFAARNVTVNAVAPGFIATDMTAELNEQQKEGIVGVIPMKRMGAPEDIAHATAFLASEEAGYITGQVFTVDGGMVM